MPEIINTMVVVDIPEGSVADGIFVSIASDVFVSVVGDVFVSIVGDAFVTSIPLVVVDIPEGLVVGDVFVLIASDVFVLVVPIFCVVETDKFLFPSVEVPFCPFSSFFPSATGTSGTRILKCSLSLK